MASTTSHITNLTGTKRKISQVAQNQNQNQNIAASIVTINDDGAIPPTKRNPKLKLSAASVVSTKTKDCNETAMSSTLNHNQEKEGEEDSRPEPEPSYFVTLVPNDEMKHKISFPPTATATTEGEASEGTEVKETTSTAAKFPQSSCDNDSNTGGEKEDSKMTSCDTLGKSMFAGSSVKSENGNDHSIDEIKCNDNEDGSDASDDDYLTNDDDDEYMDEDIICDFDLFDDDDYHSEDDSDFDEDDELDSCYDEEDYSSSMDDEDEDDDGTCSCAHCTQMMARVMASATEMFREMGDDSYNSEQGSDAADKSNEMDDDDDQKPTLPYDGPQCAVCFNDPQPKNPFVVLPCCSSDGREDTFSTRFCRKCTMKCLFSQHSHRRMGRLPPEVLMNEIIARHGALVGECPRCRALIAYNSFKEESEREPFSNIFPLGFDHVYHIDKGDICRATFLQAVVHAENHQQLAEDMRSLLFVIAHANPNFIPSELLSGESESVRKLVLWNVLEKKTDGIYCIDRIKQSRLRNHIELIRTADGDDDNIDKNFFLLLSGKIRQAAYMALCKKHIWISLRLSNYAITKHLTYLWGFPDIRYGYQECMVVSMNIFLMVCVLICLLVVKAMAWLVTLVHEMVCLLHAKKRKRVLVLTLVCIATVGIFT